MSAPHVLDDPEVRGLYLSHVATAFGPVSAARVIGCSPAAVKHYIATHPDFSEMVAEALSLPTEDVERKLYEIAMNGDAKAAVDWLKANRPEKYGVKVPQLGDGAVVLTADAVRELAAQAHRRQRELETGAVLD